MFWGHHDHKICFNPFQACEKLSSAKTFLSSRSWHHWTYRFHLTQNFVHIITWLTNGSRHPCFFILDWTNFIIKNMFPFLYGSFDVNFTLIIGRWNSKLLWLSWPKEKKLSSAPLSKKEKGNKIRMIITTLCIKQGYGLSGLFFNLFLSILCSKYGLWVIWTINHL